MKYDFIQNLETLEHIIRQSGMSIRPEFYSGRGAITCDLNSTILKRIHHGIHHKLGEEAASSFVQMVNDMEDMSATNFLKTLFSLQRQEWKWTPEIEHKERIAIDGMGSAWGTIGEVFAGNHRCNESQRIKGDFLWSMGLKPKYRQSKNGKLGYMEQYFGI